eukprot:jgi/Mesen1/742/ME000110S_11006
MVGSVTWNADTGYSSGIAYNTSAPVWGVVQLNTSLAASIYQTLRSFGGHDGPINSYFIPNSAPAASSYLVRLHFAEILFLAPSARIFDVYLDGVLVLRSFQLPTPSTAVVAELYVPPSGVGGFQVTFARGPVGDPIINGIQVIPAAELYSISAESAAYGLVTERRISCGAGALYGPDEVGREWETGTAYVSAASDAVGVLNVNSTARPHTVAGADASPMLVPLQVYATVHVGAPPANAATPSNLTYSFNVTANAAYTVKLHFVEFQASAAGQRLLTVSLNAQAQPGSVDIFARVGAKSALVQTYDVAESASSTLTVSIGASASAEIPTPTVSAIEILRVLPASTAADRLVQTSSPPAPQYMPLPLRHMASKVLQGAALGAVLALVLTASAVGAAVAVLCLRSGSGGAHDKERPKELLDLLLGQPGKGGKKKAGGAEAGAAPQVWTGRMRGLRAAAASEAGSDGQRTSDRRKTRAYSLEELSAATDNFAESNVLGKGGFGIVYRGRMQSGHMVAVKRLSLDSQQGEREFLTEVRRPPASLPAPAS